MRPFEPKDLEEINEWYARHDMPHVPLEALPPNGYIEPGVAAGFVYLTDAGTALLDGYISNPWADEALRDEALYGISDALEKAAKGAGRTHLIAIARSPTMRKRAMLRRFTPLGTFMVFGKEL